MINLNDDNDLSSPL